MNGDNNGHDEAFTDVKLEVPASTPTGDQPSYDRGERIKSEIGKIATINQIHCLILTRMLRLLMLWKRSYTKFVKRFLLRFGIKRWQHYLITIMLSEFVH